MNKTSLFFDLDGTLWDACDITYISAKTISENHNIKSPKYESIVNGMGKTINSCAKIYYPFLKLDDSIKLLNEISEEVVNKIINKEAKIYPNVNKVLKKLSETYDLYVISNTANTKYANAINNYVDVSFKECLACGSIGLNKGSGIKYIMKKNNIKKSIYIGDTNLDKISASVAKIPFIYCKYGFGNIKKCEYEINSFDELINEIKKVKL